MKNNKGFISISVVYSFFMVFLLLLLFIVNNLISNRTMLTAIENEIKEDITDATFSRYLVNHATDLGLVHHSSSLTNGAGDNSYRYSGEDPNNYVCFGSDADVCPSANLYRIIGIIGGRVKLIKATSIGEIAIDNTNTNYYVNTSIYTYLNNDFLNSLGEYSNLIATTTWYVGGINSDTITSVKNIYDYEVGINRNNLVRIDEKIGLMYISDYGYASSMIDSALTSSDNWLYSGVAEWTQSRLNTTTNEFFFITDTGTLSSGDVANLYQVRPVFYLNSTTTWQSGDGTMTSPYRIEG